VPVGALTSADQIMHLLDVESFWHREYTAFSVVSLAVLL
jgi:hypothetical protein